VQVMESDDAVTRHDYVGPLALGAIVHSAMTNDEVSGVVAISISPRTSVSDLI
jgi:hypothetical protein